MFSSFNAYWICYIIVLICGCVIIYNWRRFEQISHKSLYLLTLVASAYLCYGPLDCIVNVSHELDLAKEYRQYQQQVIIPMEERVNDAMLPDGFYYFYCEITQVETEVVDNFVVYTYSFGAVDYIENSDIYQYKTTQVLNENTQYLLVMDSLNTKAAEDDQIVTVWGLIN